ncbi:hypothetical protein HY792_03800 [Candidatus Desantisbacteria bacterium]|nr:hypothetical protein [Candidatus Desantisbacteria bacterium]
MNHRQECLCYLISLVGEEHGFVGTGQGSVPTYIYSTLLEYVQADYYLYLYE